MLVLITHIDQNDDIQKREAAAPKEGPQSKKTLLEINSDIQKTKDGMK